MSRKTVILTSSTACHARPRFFSLLHLSTISLSTCTPIRPPIRPSTRPSMLSASHGDMPCDDPSNVSFGSVAESHSPTSYEPKDLTAEDTSLQVEPMFFHRPSVTSTYDPAESIATPPPPPESDLDDEQVRNMLDSPLYLQEREASAELSKFISLPRKCRETCTCVLTSKKVESRISNRERRRFLTTSTNSGKDETPFRFYDWEDAATLVSS